MNKSLFAEQMKKETTTDSGFMYFIAITADVNTVQTVQTFLSAIVHFVWEARPDFLTKVLRNRKQIRLNPATVPHDTPRPPHPLPDFSSSR